VHFPQAVDRLHPTARGDLLDRRARGAASLIRAGAVATSASRPSKARVACTVLGDAQDHLGRRRARHGAHLAPRSSGPVSRPLAYRHWSGNAQDRLLQRTAWAVRRPAAATSGAIMKRPGTLFRSHSQGADEFIKTFKESQFFLDKPLHGVHQVCLKVAGCYGPTINVMSTQFISGLDAPGAEVRRRVAEGRGPEPRMIPGVGAVPARPAEASALR